MTVPTASNESNAPANAPADGANLAQTPASRRRMLAGLGAVGAAGAAVAVLPLAQQPVAAAAKAALADPPEAGGGYQLTEHVRRYYQTTRV